MDSIPPLAAELEPPVAEAAALPQPPPNPTPDARREVWFDDPDAAYLVVAFVRHHLDATVSASVVLVPTQRGPGLEIAGPAAEHRVVRALIRRFGGHVASG